LSRVPGRCELWAPAGGRQCQAIPLSVSPPDLHLRTAYAPSSRISPDPDVMYLSQNRRVWHSVVEERPVKR
jgi:hypothetical protein